MKELTLKDKLLRAGVTAAAGAGALSVSAAFGAWLRVFWVDRKRTLDPYCWPKTPRFSEYGDRIKELIDSALAIPFEEVTAESFDGYTLYGRLYITDPEAPLQIMFHGYRENAVTDFCGGLQLALGQGMNALLVDQRAHGKSGGRGLSFGILERFDVKTWAELAAARFGADRPLILSGISMGAATVLMASELELPEGVRGIIADCGYSSPAAIIEKVSEERGYPGGLMMPLVKLGARLFGGFDLTAASPKDAVRKTGIPVLFIHGEDDGFVPCAMTMENYDACASEKRLFLVPGAAHGMAYLTDPEGYAREVKDFRDMCLSRV